MAAASKHILVLGGEWSKLDTLSIAAEEVSSKNISS